MYNVNKSYFRDNSLNSIAHIEKIGVIRYHDNYKQAWNTHLQAKRLHGKTSLKPYIRMTRTSVK